MAATTVTNWFGDLSSQPAVVVEAESTEEVVAILRDSNRYPSPVRAIGSFHSTAACGAADGGTMIRMSKMNRILSTGPDTITVEAGAIYIDCNCSLRTVWNVFYPLPRYNHVRSTFFCHQAASD